MKTASLAVLALLLVASNLVQADPALTVPAIPGRESLVMGRFSFTKLRPTAGNYRIVSYSSVDGIDTERFELTAAAGRFVYYSEGPERRPLIEGRISNLHVAGLKRNRVVNDIQPLFELESADAMTFILTPKLGTLDVTPLLGGAVSIGQPRVWVGNAGPVSITPSSAEGAIRFRAADVTWSGVRIRLPDVLGELGVDTRADDPKVGAEFLLDFASGSLDLQAGSFAWQAGRRWESSASLSARAMRLRAMPGSVDVEISDLKIPASSLDLGKGLAAPVVAPGTFSMAKLEGRADRGRLLASIASMTVTGASLVSPVSGFTAAEIETLPFVQAAIRQGTITSAESGRQAAIAETAAALAALDRVDFALHMPARAIVGAFTEAVETVSRAGNEIEADLDLGMQQIRIGLRLNVRLPGLTVPVALAVLVAPSMDGRTVVLHPSVQVAVPGSFKSAGSIDLTGLLASLRSGVGGAISRGRQVEVRVPLDLSVIKRLDPSTVAPPSPNLTLSGTAVDARFEVPRAVLVIDGAGLHVAGKLEVSL